MKKIVILFNLMLSVTLANATNINTMEIKAQKEPVIFKLIQKNDLEGVKRELKNGINVNITDANNRSILLIATYEHHIEIAKFLVAHGADVNLQANNKDTPFLFAGASGQTELVKVYLENGARFDVFNRYNGTALIPACERGHIETVRLLANTTKFPIDHVNNLGWTALMEAVILGDGSKKYQQIVQILKEAGAKLNIADRDHITPLQHAQSRGYTEIVKILSK